eukprot:2498136-Karenia_brevis.AAC.1
MLEVNVFKQVLGEYLGVPKKLDFNFNLEVLCWRLMFSSSFWLKISGVLRKLDFKKLMSSNSFW